ncbi:MAG: ATPase [Acidimicrobiaceae bacterium]|nr:ATPase [Acidimicrobiaceae bacterium]
MSPLEKSEGASSAQKPRRSRPKDPATAAEEQVEEAALAPSKDHLLLLLALIEAQVRTAVAARRSVDPNPDDAFRGLYLTDDDADRLVAGGWPALAPPSAELVAARARVEESLLGEAARGQTRSSLGRLVGEFGLASIDVDLLVVALAPDLDSRFERLYGYLNDDVTRRRATIGLALELCGMRPTDPAARGRLRAGAPLLDGGLVLIEEDDRPFLTRSLRVPDRVAAHLLGDDAPVPAIAGLLADDGPVPALDPSGLARALQAGARLVYLRERQGSAGRGLARQALAAAGWGAVDLDLSRVGPELDLTEIAALAAREARLGGAGLVAGPLEAFGELSGARERSVVRAFADLPCPVILLGRAGWDPAWSRQVPVVLVAPEPAAEQRRMLWAESLGPEIGAAVEQEVGAFRLAPEQVARAGQSAKWWAAYEGESLAGAHARSGALAENAAGLERMARRVRPEVGWEDLVLPPATFRLLGELVDRVLFRDRVLGEWRMRAGGGRGRGVTALFAGDSGTGKTMSAEVVAGRLGLELYTINLATVVDKYVGETEKNLERIFSEVDGVNGVLLFDEADALFGKRSEVRDAHDRYANIEVAYLLQRIESFDGLAVLTTNLRANVDEAFTRRLDTVIDFPFPDSAQRRTLWEYRLGKSVPLAADVDLEFLADAFELSGGNIASIALTAAYLAAGSGEAVTMADLVRAVHREYRKLGRLSVRSEFKEWFHVVEGEVAG